MAAVERERTILFVGNLHPNVTKAILIEKFENAGEVLNVLIYKNRYTQQLYSHVDFSRQSEAETALKTMNFDILLGKSIRVMWYEQDLTKRDKATTSLFIKNLDQSIDNKFFYKRFSEFGTVLSSTVATDNVNGKCLGYGYVQYETKQMAYEAIVKANGSRLKSTNIFVSPFIPRYKRKMTANVYIKNFGDDLDDRELYNMFEPCGGILSHKVMLDNNGQSKGFGFVCFYEIQSAKLAIQQFNGMNLNNRILYVGWAKTKCRNFERSIKHLKKILYVNFLDPQINTSQLTEMFTPFGNVTFAKVMVENDVSKGCGMVCFSCPIDAYNAQQQMNGEEIFGKSLCVVLASTYKKRQMFTK
ncbi:Polyadenylate-binding protein 1 [Chamberlinius hualienensis]